MSNSNNMSLCSLAKIAKERLRHNQYTREIKSNTIDNAKCFARYIYSKKNNTNHCEKQDERKKCTYDEDLYKKVCKLIENKSTSNPILFLMDKDLFNNLDVEAKQFYINNLTQKYKSMRIKYYKEHSYAF